MHAEIAGAGFAGLAAAIALRRRGWSVRVHEKEAELRAFGAGIFIWENGQRVLQAIGAYDDVARGAHQAPGYETRRNGVNVSFEKINGANRFLLMTMTRQHLYSAIIASARREGIEILTSSEVVGAKPEGVLELADGTRLEADLVIAADGVRSAVRDSLGHSGRAAQVSGWHRARARRPRAVHGRRLGACDRLLGVRAPHAPHPLCALRGREALLRHDGAARRQGGGDPPHRSRVWGDVFPMLLPGIETIGDRGRYDVYETTKLQSWSHGRIAIIGDAAHALPPTLAQGACLAMMNALSLAEIVTAGSDLEASLETWEAQERPLTDHTQARSAELAATRALGAGMQWDDIGLRAAQHVPFGTRPEEFARAR